MNRIVKEYRKRVKKAIKQYKQNRTAENLQAYQIAYANYNTIKRQQVKG